MFDSTDEKLHTFNFCVLWLLMQNYIASTEDVALIARWIGGRQTFEFRASENQ